MKKFTSPLSFFLSLFLLAGLVSPAALADGQEIPFSVEAAAAILIDADTGEVLYEQAPDERRFPASITKVMTGLLTVEAVERGELTLETTVTLSDTLYTGIGWGGSTQNLEPGEVLTIRDLLNCALIPSANEACNALAEAISGSIPAFVELMNQRAQELGMTSTHFMNTHGYHDDNHYTTARDIAKMCQTAMALPTFREIVSRGTYTVPATNLHDARVLQDTNALVSGAKVSGFRYQYAIGIKTGSTPEAGYCLASAAEKNHRTLIAVLLGGKNWIANDQVVSDNYFTESRRLLEHGFNSFSRKTVLDTIEPVGTVPVTLCAQQDYVTVLPAQSITATLPNDLDPAVFDRSVALPDTLRAPIEKGQVLGTITISYEGKDYGTVDLVADTTLAFSRRLAVIEFFKSLFRPLWVKILLLVLTLFVLLIVLRRMVFGPPRRRPYRSSQPRTHASSYRGRKR